MDHRPVGARRLVVMSAGLSVFVINLDRSPDRWAAMVEQLDRLGLEPTRVPAVDARRDPAKMRARRGFPKPIGDAIFEMNAEGRRYLMTEEACFQSHMKALETFLGTEATVALILEDDAELAPDIKILIEAAERMSDRWDVIRLESPHRRGVRRALKIADLPGDRMMVASMRPVSGACAYLVTRGGAKGLIAAAPGVFEPFDTFLSTVNRHRLKLLDCAPAAARQSGTPSVINAERDAGVATPSRRSPGVRAAFRRLKADLNRRLPRRWLFPHMFRGQHQGWVQAPWTRDW
jgi:glycosyl transferase family 25